MSGTLCSLFIAEKRCGTNSCPFLPVCRRYGRNSAPLRHIFSEYGLIRYRILVECRWLQQLSRIAAVEEVPPFTADANAVLDKLATQFSVHNALEVRFGLKQLLTAVRFVLKQLLTAGGNHQYAAVHFRHCPYFHCNEP